MGLYDQLSLLLGNQAFAMSLGVDIADEGIRLLSKHVSGKGTVNTIVFTVVVSDKYKAGLPANAVERLESTGVSAASLARNIKLTVEADENLFLVPVPTVEQLEVKLPTLSSHQGEVSSLLVTHQSRLFMTVARLCCCVLLQSMCKSCN